MKRFRFSWLRGIFVTIIVFGLVLLVPNIGNVRAMLTSAHELYTVWRFEREVLRDTRVGQYYEGLIFKHAKEAVELLLKDPNGEEKFNTFRDTTIPLLDAYMNGQGDSTIITAESMNAFKDILDELSVAGGSSMQKDIQMEYERFPLDRFVGMNMNEAYIHVLDSFAGVLDEPVYVEGTDGKWASYIYDGVYFEYPGNWYVQILEINKEDKSAIIIIPSSENPSHWDGEWIIIGIATNVSPEAAFNGGFSFNTNGYDLLWKKSIQVNEVDGVEYAAQYRMAALIAAELYNSEKSMFVDAGVILFDPLGIQLDDTLEIMQERYEYFFHLVNSVRIIQP